MRSENYVFFWPAGWICPRHGQVRRGIIAASTLQRLAKLAKLAMSSPFGVGKTWKNHIFCRIWPLFNGLQGKVCFCDFYEREHPLRESGCLGWAALFHGFSTFQGFGQAKRRSRPGARRAGKGGILKKNPSTSDLRLPLLRHPGIHGGVSRVCSMKRR